MATRPLPAPLSRASAPLLDALLAGFLAAGAAGIAVAESADAARIAASIAATLPLAFRRRAPLLVLAALVAGRSADWLVAPDSESIFEFLAFLVALYTVVSRSSPRAIAAGAALALAGLLLQLVRFPGDDWPDHATGAAITYGIAAAVGVVVRRREFETSALRGERKRLERERVEALREERLRIARELHDVVAHSVSVMVLHASAAGRVGDDRPDELRRALSTVESVGRGAAGELQRLLDLLREDGAPEGAPFASLDHLDVLAQPLRAAGLDVSFRVEGDIDDLLPGVTLCAYRVVQEALTNVLKHSQASRAEVSLARRDRSLEIAIEDDGRGLSARSSESGRVGHGLLGMQERVALFDGTLSVTEGPGGGVAVRARLPLHRP